MKIEIFKDEGGQWRYRVRAANNEIVQVSEAYVSKGNVRRAVDELKAENLAEAEVVELDEE